MAHSQPVGESYHKSPEHEPAMIENISRYVSMIRRRSFSMVLARIRTILEQVLRFIQYGTKPSEATSSSRPEIDQLLQQCLALRSNAQSSVAVTLQDSMNGCNVLSTSTHSSVRTVPRSRKISSPLQDGKTMSSTCDHNGGIITSKDGIKIIIPKGAIMNTDLITLYISVAMFGPFVIPSKRQTDLVSPYYWIGVSRSYHFHKPVQVEFEHFGACDPSHYQLLCCEDDDESYSMRPVNYDLKFKVQGDNILYCSFQTTHFCSYCLFHACDGPVLNRIGAFYLKPENFQFLTHFTVEIWFSFPISRCLRRNEELYKKKGLALDVIYSYKVASDKNSSSYFALDYDRCVNDWYVCHSRSTEIQTKEINFYNFFDNVEHLLAHEENALFPPRFIVTVTKKPECSADLDTNIKVSLCEVEEKKSLASFQFKLFVSISNTTVKSYMSQSVSDHDCHKHQPSFIELMNYSIKILSHWELIALHLGIPGFKIESIDKDHSNDLESKCCEMFKIWLQTDKSPCWCRFVHALVMVGLNEVAEEAKVHLLASCDNTNAMALLDITEDNLKSKEFIPSLYEFVKNLKAVPDGDLKYFIICLLPNKNGLQVIKDIRRSGGSKEEKIKKIYETFFNENNPSWTKVYDALREAECDDLAATIKTRFLPG